MRELGFHYPPSLKAKKVKTYMKYVEYFKNNFKDVDILEINDRHYYCVKKMEKCEMLSHLFSPELYTNQLRAKGKGFER